MDKFLNLCFKAGKILFSIMLVISLIVALVMLCRTIGDTIKMNNIRVSYSYDVKKIIKDELSLEKNLVNSDTNKNELKAENIIKEFAQEQNLSKHMTDELIKVVAIIDEKEQINYFKHFIKFFNNYKEEAISLMEKERNADRGQVENFIKTNINNIVYEEYIKFYGLYKIEKESKLIEKQQQENNRNMNFLSLLISLGVFILCLFLPILIRIEENTRNESR